MMRDPFYSVLIRHDSANQYFFFENRLMKSDRKMVCRLAFQFNFFKEVEHCSTLLVWRGFSTGNRRDEVPPRSSHKNKQLGD